MPDKTNKDNGSNKAENTEAAYNEAQKDIEQDDELNPDDPTKDLDEGEYARQQGDSKDESGSK
jgi:hypothetical protein